MLNTSQEPKGIDHAVIVAKQHGANPGDSDPQPVRPETQRRMDLGNLRARIKRANEIFDSASVHKGKWGRAKKNLKEHREQAQALRDEIAAEWREYRAQWAKSILMYVDAVEEGKRLHPATQDYGPWFKEFEQLVGTRFNNQDRAALRNLAEHRDVAERKIRDTERKSIQLFWKHDVRPVVRQREEEAKRQAELLTQKASNSLKTENHQDRPADPIDGDKKTIEVSTSASQAVQSPSIAPPITPPSAPEPDDSEVEKELTEIRDWVIRNKQLAETDKHVQKIRNAIMNAMGCSDATVTPL
jgi:hypothetical protein